MAGTFGGMAVVMRNILTHASVPGGNTENEMTYEMRKFVKFSEYNIVNDHC
jgi:hypothetical protein